MRFTAVFGGVTLAAVVSGAAFAADEGTTTVALRAVPTPELSGVPVDARGDVISWVLVTNGPVPDTPANRATYEPLSHAGRTTAPTGD